MPRTISDAEFAHLMGRKQVADFVEPIYNSKELGPDARALIKRAYPNLQMEGYDLKNELKGDIAQERADRLEAERQRTENEENEKFRQLRKKTQDDFKFTDEGMERLETLMTERNIGDYEAGALLLASKEPRATDENSGTYAGGGRYWNYDKQNDFAEISQDPEKWGYNKLVAAAQRDAARMKNQGF